MKNARLALFVFCAAATMMGASTWVQAQATRTWVSGVGDDVNPCSRTAPCKTFAGAISKTAPGGEIDTLDPGGYGAVTITKSITIDGSTGTNMAGLVNSFTNGIIINAAATDTVTLRNISIDGTNTGLVGVKILAAGGVFLENLQVFNQSGQGIYDQRIAGGQLFIENSQIRDNNSTGITIIPSTGSTAIEAMIRNVRSIGNGNTGLTVGAGAHVTVLNSVFSGNVNYGIYVEQPAGSTQVFVGDSSISGNLIGIINGGGSPTIRLSNVTVFDNNTGLEPNGVTVFSFGNNKFSGNAAGGGPFSPPLSIIASQ